MHDTGTGIAIRTIYLVGGAVRDQLLGLPVTERDWVVVGCTPEKLLQAGFRYIDPDFPVFLHPHTHEEYALARREINTTAGYRGFALDISRTVSLESDLARRDLTVNALAQDECGRLIDPFHGQRDLQAHCLRHITPAFSDDPVRVLRVARFAAKLGHLGFYVAADTIDLMQKMVLAGSLSALQPQRIWLEMLKAFGYAQPWHFFTVLEACGAWSAGLLTGQVNQQPNSFEAALAALRRACALTDDPLVRFAAFWLQCPEPAALAGVIEKRFARFLAQSRLAWQHFLQLPRGSAETVLDFLQRQQAWHPQGRYAAVMQVVEAQAVQLDLLDFLEHARHAAASVRAETLRAQGLQGAAIGQALQAQRCANIAAVWSR